MRRNSFAKCIVFLYILAVVIFYAVIGENSYIAVQDNLDLFMAQFAMLKNTGSFFSHGVDAPFLGGISRDVLPSELSLYTVLFMFLPPFAAYVTGYCLKILIAVFSCRLLFLDIIYERERGSKRFDGESISPVFLDEHVENLVTLAGLLYGVLNMFPAFGIPFAAIPLIIYLLRRAYRAAAPGVNIYCAFKRSLKWLILIFLYPFLSYFSYIGFFILGYLFIAILFLWIRDRKLSWSLVLSLIFLGAGNVAFEYRLFSMMLFSDTVTIRDTMTWLYLSPSEIAGQIWDIFVNGMMHADDAHRYFIMPLCAVYFIFLNVRYILKKNFRGIFTDYFNLGVLLLVFNCIVYGLYYSEAVAGAISTVLPPLKGFQYNRTIFFNPFIWCCLLLIISYRMYIWASEVLFVKRTSQRAGRLAADVSYLVVFAAIFVVVFSPTKYNDLYHTALLTAREQIFHHENDDLSFKEFYSVKLFDEIKRDIGYKEGEYCVAYGMHPAVLEYNGIYTLDGYLGFYPQSYKEAFREVIAPALERKDNTRAYFDEWGARCYLYSGTDDSIVMATRSMQGVTDTDIYIDAEALRGLGCRYIFSRIDISNADETGIEYIGSYHIESSPYTIYLYGL